jgi:addiction module RelE/StbE family toxin
MNKLDLQIKSKALDDMKKIADYIARDNKSAARNLLNDFYLSFDRLCDFPKMGAIKKDFTYLDVRFLRVKQNYLIVYNFDKKSIYILRVLSSYQEICNLL